MPLGKIGGVRINGLRVGGLRAQYLSVGAIISSHGRPWPPRQMQPGERWPDHKDWAAASATLRSLANESLAGADAFIGSGEKHPHTGRQQWRSLRREERHVRKESQILSFAELCQARVFIAECLLGRRVLTLSASLNVRAIGWNPHQYFFSIYRGVARIFHVRAHALFWSCDTSEMTTRSSSP